VPRKDRQFAVRKYWFHRKILGQTQTRSGPLKKTHIAEALDANWYRVEKMLTLLEKQGLIRTDQRKGYVVTDEGWKWFVSFVRLTDFLYFDSS
jgi:Mn-dependent DtxR family transcriptional regulator